MPATAGCGFWHPMGYSDLLYVSVPAADEDFYDAQDLYCAEDDVRVHAA